MDKAGPKRLKAWPATRLAAARLTAAQAPAARASMATPPPVLQAPSLAARALRLRADLREHWKCRNKAAKWASRIEDVCKNRGYECSTDPIRDAGRLPGKSLRDG